MGILAALGGLVIKGILPGLATLISGLVVGLLNKKLKQAGIELDDKQQARVRQIVEDAIKAAEEAARRKANTSQPMTSDAKRDLAVAIIKSKIPQLDPLDLALALDSALPKVRSTIKV